MSSRQRREFAIQFAKKDDLGNLCVLLRDENVPFRLGGFETIVLVLDQEKMLKSLPERPRHFVESHTHKLVPADRDDKRRGLLNQEQTEELLREFVKRR